MEIMHKLTIMTPLNKDGEGALAWETEFDEKNFRIMEITRKQYDGLFWLFDKFNSEFSLLIDRFEEESLPPRHLDRAIKIAEEFAPSVTTEECRSALRELYGLLRFAKSNGSEVVFDF